MTQHYRLFRLWIVGYGISLAMIVSFQILHYTVPDLLVKNLLSVTGIFAPYLTPITGFFLTARKNHNIRETNSEAFKVAIILSGVFNVLMIMIISTVYFTSGEAIIEKNLENASMVAATLAIIVGPPIGWFFAKTK